MGALLSVVVPCYNEQDVIEETYQRLTTVLDRMSSTYDLDYELVFVDDGSLDQTFSNIQQMTQAGVTCLRLSRNFGKEIAL